MENYLAGPGVEVDEEENEMEEYMSPLRGIRELIKDKDLEKEFKYLYKEFRLANLTPQQERLFRELISAALQLQLYEEKYRKKGVNLDLREPILMILAEAEAIAVASRSRGGFERRMLATSIQEIEQKETSERKDRLKLFTFLRGGGG